MPTTNTTERSRRVARAAWQTATAALLSCWLCAPVLAADLRVGIKADPAIDPQYLYLAPNIAIARHMFEPLIATNADETPDPRLAVSWKAISDTEWEFKLRPNVKFSDGSPFTAEDVIFSMNRGQGDPQQPQPLYGGLAHGHRCKRARSADAADQDIGSEPDPADSASNHLHRFAYRSQGRDAGGLRVGQGRDWHGAVHVRLVHAGRQPRPAPQPRATGATSRRSRT